jgi:hypothetical protein
MALLGQHFSNASASHWTSRVQLIWPSSRPAPALCFKTFKTEKPDPAACQNASAIYAGEISLSAEEFLSLSWLQCFARSGRQLLLCHALLLLNGWSEQRKTQKIKNDDIDILHTLCRAAPDFIATLNTEMLLPLKAALQQQIGRVLSIRTKTPSGHIVKADALFCASQLVEDGYIYSHEAVHLWDQSIPVLVAGDGSPLQHELSDFISWISPLLASHKIAFQPATRQALDRASAFLAMLVRPDGRYCFSNQRAVEAVTATPPPRQAAHGKVVHLKAGKTTIIAAAPPSTTQPFFSISAQGQHVFDAEWNLAEPMSQTSLHVQQSEHGQVAEFAAAVFQRVLFLSPDGADVRVEDQVQAPDDRLTFHLNPDLTLAIARSGTQASLSFGPKTLWQLNLRGGRFVEIGHHQLSISQSAPRLQWALKAIARTQNKPAKPEALELPF